MSNLLDSEQQPFYLEPRFTTLQNIFSVIPQSVHHVHNE